MGGNEGEGVGEGEEDEMREGESNRGNDYCSYFHWSSGERNVTHTHSNPRPPLSAAGAHSPVAGLVSATRYAMPQLGRSLVSTSGVCDVAPMRSAVTSPDTPLPVTGRRDQETRAAGSRTTTLPAGNREQAMPVKQ